MVPLWAPPAAGNSCTPNRFEPTWERGIRQPSLQRIPPAILRWLRGLGATKENPLGQQHSEKASRHEQKTKSKQGNADYRPADREGEDCPHHHEEPACHDSCGPPGKNCPRLCYGMRGHRVPPGLDFFPYILIDQISPFSEHPLWIPPLLHCPFPPRDTGTRWSQQH